MAFKIEKANNPRSYQPEGHYIHLNGIDWLVQDLTISASGKICLKLYDYVRKDNQIRTLCTLEELIQATVEGATYKEV